MSRCVAEPPRFALAARASCDVRVIHAGRRHGENLRKNLSVYLEPYESKPAWTRGGPVPRHRRYLFSLAAVPWPCATLPVFGSSDCRLSLHVMLCGCFVRDGAFFLRIVMSCSL